MSPVLIMDGGGREKKSYNSKKLQLYSMGIFCLFTVVFKKLELFLFIFILQGEAKGTKGKVEKRTERRIGTKRLDNEQDEIVRNVGWKRGLRRKGNLIFITSPFHLLSSKLFSFS